MRFFTLGLLALAAFPAIACTQTVDSSDVRTSGVYADMSVLAKGNGSSDVSVGLKVGGASSNTYLVMKNADKLTATDGTDTKTLSRSGDYYQTTFGVDAGDTLFTIAFMRGPNDTNAPDSNVTLPPPFTLAGIAAGQTVSRQAGFTAAWDPSAAGDRMRSSLDGDCLFRTDKSFADTGTVTISGTDFNVQSGQEQATCQVTFCVERFRNGTLDPAYGDGGVIDATQQRCVAVNAGP